MFFLFLALCIFSRVSADFVPHLGPCPRLNAVEPFDMNEYAGVWFETERSSPNPFESLKKCGRLNYTLVDTSTYKIVARFMSILSGVESYLIVNATQDMSSCQNSTSCGRLDITFNPLARNEPPRKNDLFNIDWDYWFNWDAPKFGRTVKYWILDTDYSSYSVIWSCTNYIFFHTRNAWILTRDQIPDDSVIQKALSVLSENGLGHVPLVQVDQENCP